MALLPVLASAALLAAAPASSAAPAVAAPAGAAVRTPTLPSPTGPYALGTHVAHLRDAARPDLVSGQPGRELTVQLWYPARPAAGAAPAPYVPEPAVLQAMRERGYFHQEAPVIEAWARVRTHAVRDAPAREDLKPLPVLVLSHGHGLSRAHYTALAEELASQGYVVAAVDHPYGGVMQRKDGRVLTLAEDPGNTEDEAVLAERAQQWARDAAFVLDWLAGPTAPAAARLADSRHAGMLGHSLGGTAALQACRTDTRFQACADFDGPPPAEVREKGLGGATLLVLSHPEYSDAELAGRGRTRAQWEELGRERGAMLDALLARRPEVPAWRLELRGTGHLSFSDAPFVMPTTITRWGGKVIAPERGHALLTTYVRAFFDRQLRARPAPLLDGPAPAAPEVLLTPAPAGRGP